MPLAAALAQPPRCVLVNLATAESIECLFNPKDLTVKLDIIRTRLTVPALSHQVLLFLSTGNRQLSGVKFFLDWFFATEATPDVGVLDF